MIDYMTDDGATHLARTIRRHWRLRGFKGIDVRVEPVDGQEPFYQVRTNIGSDGFPPRA